MTFNVVGSRNVISHLDMNDMKSFSASSWRLSEPQADHESQWTSWNKLKTVVSCFQILWNVKQSLVPKNGLRSRSINIWEKIIVRLSWTMILRSHLPVASFPFSRTFTNCPFPNGWPYFWTQNHLSYIKKQHLWVLCMKFDQEFIFCGTHLQRNLSTIKSNSLMDCWSMMGTTVRSHTNCASA